MTVKDGIIARFFRFEKEKECMKENPDSFCHLTKWYILAYIEYCKENKR